jgi:ABC-type Na+ efflux pump permease subunit
MIVKEFRQLRRDRRTLAMMVVLPVLLLVAPATLEERFLELTMDHVR